MNMVADENYYDLIIDNNIVNNYGPSENITYLNNEHSILHIKSASPIDMCKIGTYPFYFFPSLFTLNAEIHYASNIDKVQSNPNLALFGEGVLVAVIDTGIDYQHDAFTYNDKTSRIYSIWDQTINENNTPPEGFTYGTEYTNEMINGALKSSNPLEMVPTVDTIGHGTSIAGVIAGRPNVAAGFTGVVPESQLVVVKLKPAKKLNKQILCVAADALCYEETDVIAGIRYVNSIADKLNRPMAVCIALGTGQGGHDGRGETSTYLNTITMTSKRSVAIAGGNEGNKRRHYLGKISTPSYTDMELHVSEKDSGFPLEIWQRSPFRISVDITTPTGETETNLYPRLNECRKITFIREPATVWVNNIISEAATGDQVILIRLQNPSSGIWRFRVYNLDNQTSDFHSWLPSGDIISDDTYFVDSNPDTTITSPGNATYPLTITAYNDSNNSIVLSSGRGYTRRDIVKPDLAAPGYNISCPIPDNRYATATGTGVAAAHATGIMAMILEWAVVKGHYTTIIGTDVNGLLIRGADRSPDLTYPNKIWGYGTIDVYGLFEKLV